MIRWWLRKNSRRKQHWGWYVSFLKYGKNGEIVIFTIGYTEKRAHVFPIAQMTNYPLKHCSRTSSWIFFMSGKVFHGISVSLHLNAYMQFDLVSRDWLMLRKWFLSICLSIFLFVRFYFSLSDYPRGLSIDSKTRPIAHRETNAVHPKIAEMPLDAQRILLNGIERWIRKNRSKLSL